MPMFDNPRKELQRLQEQLLAEEEEELEELIEEYGEEDYEEFFEENYEEEYRQEPFYRNYANGYREKSIFDEIEHAFEEEDDEEPFALFTEEKRGLFGRRKKVKSKKGSNKGLKTILLLEIIGILCLLIWWVVMKL